MGYGNALVSPQIATLPHSALTELLNALQAIESESLAPVSRFPLKIYPVNEDMDIYFPPF